MLTHLQTPGPASAQIQPDTSPELVHAPKDSPLFGAVFAMEGDSKAGQSETGDQNMEAPEIVAPLVPSADVSVLLTRSLSEAGDIAPDKPESDLLAQSGGGSSQPDPSIGKWSGQTTAQVPIAAGLVREDTPELSAQSMNSGQPEPSEQSPEPDPVQGRADVRQGVPAATGAMAEVEPLGQFVSIGQGRSSQPELPQQTPAAPDSATPVPHKADQAAQMPSDSAQSAPAGNPSQTKATPGFADSHQRTAPHTSPEPLDRNASQNSQPALVSKSDAVPAPPVQGQVAANRPMQDMPSDPRSPVPKDGAGVADTEQVEGSVPRREAAPPERPKPAPTSERVEIGDLLTGEAKLSLLSSETPTEDLAELVPRAVGSSGLTSAPVQRASDPAAAQQVARQIGEAIVSTRAGQTIVTLDPEELGRVQMTITPSDDSVVVGFVTERSETESLMRRHIALLGQQLRDLGYSDVSFDFGSGGAESGKTQQTAHTGAGAPDASHSEPAVQASALINASGGLDIRL